MKVSRIVAMIAIIATTAEAQNYTSGQALRRGIPAQNYEVVQTVVPVETRVIQQPTTIVESTPAAESRAEAMRRARQEAELKTEQKIVERLEESRLREEQERAERLFGNKGAQTQQEQVQQIQTAPVQAVPVITTAPAQTVTVPAAQQEQKPQVVIEKVEIIQPAPVLAPKEEAAKDVTKEVVVEQEEKVLSVENKEEQADEYQYFGGVFLGGMDYQSDNVSTDFGIGFVGGVLINNRFSLEGSLMYSEHDVDTYWQSPIYKSVEQYDLQFAAKYYLTTGRFRPYVGGSGSYIFRKYTDRVFDYNYYLVNSSRDESENSHSVNFGLLGGLDMFIAKNFVLSTGLEWNTNLMGKSDFDPSKYGVPDNRRPLEETDYMVFKLGVRYLF